MESLNYVQYDLKFHIVWMTKYHYKVISEKVAERCRHLIIESCFNMDVDIIKGIIGQNYVYLVLSCPPNISVLKIVNSLKRKTSAVLLNEYQDLKEKFLNQQIWSNGYFCGSVGSVTKKLIKEYIEDQQYEDNFVIIDD